jgi:hypothetical protein
MVTAPPVELIAIDVANQCGKAGPDELLSTYLGQTTEAAAEEILHQLLTEHASPVARSVLLSISPRDSDDGTQQVLMDLTTRLRRMRQGEDNPIQNFAAYVASTARRAASLIARRSNPSRFRLRNRLRYALQTSSTLTLWTDRTERTVCGLRRYSGSEADAKAGEALQNMAAGAGDRTLLKQLEKVLAPLPGPVFLDEVTAYFGQFEGNIAKIERFDEAWTVEGSNLAREMDMRASLANLWGEIRELPRNQRVALLLNLRDHIGDSALRLFPALGLATIRQLAQALEMEAGELAEIWGKLPLEDLELAEMLGLSRQQVINLRKSARQRLARRSSR